MPQSNLGTYTNGEAQSIEDTLKLPTPVLQKGLDEYNNIKETMEGKHSLLNVVHPLIDRQSEVRYKFPLDKFSIYNRASNQKNRSINDLDETLINRH